MTQAQTEGLNEGQAQEPGAMPPAEAVLKNGDLLPTLTAMNEDLYRSGQYGEKTYLDIVDKIEAARVFNATGRRTTIVKEETNKGGPSYEAFAQHAKV